MYNSLVQQLRTRDDPDTLWKIYLSLPSRLNLITSRSPPVLFFSHISLDLKCIEN
jgi:hypothetical protein